MTGILRRDDRNFPRLFRNSPFYEVFDLLNDMDRNWMFQQPSTEWTANNVKVDENEKGYLLSIDLPGVGPDDIDLSAEDGRLIIKAERKNTFGEHGHEETQVMKYERSFTLPEDAQEDIEAHLDHGVLRLLLPKVAKPKPKTIKLTHGNESKGFLEKFIGGSKTKPELKRVNSK